MTDQYHCGCGFTSTNPSNHDEQTLKKAEQYRCGCGYTSEKPGTHCGQPLKKAA